MGISARWVCHTCKTVCSRGGRPIFQHIADSYTVSSIDYFKDILIKFHSNFEFDDYERYMLFLDDLREWLKRHENHTIHIGSDYSTDMMDLDDYRDETLVGKISKFTRMEAQLAAIEATEETNILEIKDIIERYGEDTKGAAKEVYAKFYVLNA